MLVLSRRNHESIVVGGRDGVERLLRVTVIDVRDGVVKLGIEAHRDVPVHRSEVWERIHAAGGMETAGAEPVAPVA